MLNGQPGPLETKSPPNEAKYGIDAKDEFVMWVLRKVLSPNKLEEIMDRNANSLAFIRHGWIQIIPGEDLSRTTPSPNAKEKEGVNVAP